jgi:hypothetical protein
MDDGSEPTSGLEGQILSITRDFLDIDERRFLIQELKDELGKVSYEWDLDEERWCMVYGSSDDAMRYYTSCQIQAMADYKYLMSELAGRDLGETVLKGDFEKHHIEFSDFWRRTHKYIPVIKKNKESDVVEKELACY